MVTGRCRFCEAGLDWQLVDLARTPLANDYLTRKRMENRDYAVLPLEVRVCSTCLLAQTTENIDPAEIFSAHYAYYSSFSQSWLLHAQRYAAAMIERFNLGPESQVVEIASNDGYLLRYFLEAGVRVLGIEPASDTADKAIALGIATEKYFFGCDIARDLVKRGIRADLIPANNVLAHVPDIRDFVAGIAILLAPKGVATFEFPHVLRLIQEVQFDTIYHEHYSYLSLAAVERILCSAELRVFDVQELPTHGGSLRIFASHEAAGHRVTDRLRQIRDLERAAKLGVKAGYEGFASRVENVKRSFSEFMAESRAAGRKVAAYGAAAKGNTFLNVCGATAEDIVCVFDRNHAKQGLWLPGSHIPIVAPETVTEVRPDILVILPWNLRDEVREQMRIIESWGGRCAVAVPEIRMLD